MVRKNVLTKLQEECLTFIVQYHKINGVSPSRKEIATEMGHKSQNSVMQHLKALKKKGYIKIDEHRKRNIIIISPSYVQTSLFNSGDFKT